MKTGSIWLSVLIVSLLLAGIACNRPEPPVAKEIPYTGMIGNESVSDPWHWLENPDDPGTKEYILAENEYTDRYFEHLRDLKKKLRKEFGERTDYTGESGSVPGLNGDYLYYSKVPAGKKYPVHYRKQVSGNSKEEIVLDENVLADGSQDFSVEHFTVSPTNSGYFFFCKPDDGPLRLIIRNFSDTGFGDTISAQVTSAVWNSDGTAIVYVKNAKEVCIHKIKSGEKDLTVFLETRTGLTTDLTLSQSASFIFISSSDNESGECSYIPADLKSLKPVVIEPFRTGHKYTAGHFGSDLFLILSNRDSPVRKLYKTRISQPEAKNWVTLLQGTDTTFLERFTIIEEKYLVLMEKKNLNASLRLIDLLYGGKDNQITFKEPDGDIRFLYFDKEDHKIIFSFVSMLTPLTVYAYDIDSRKLTIRKRPAVKDYRKEDYIVEQVWAKSGNGTRIPITLIHKNGMKLSDGKNPVYLTAFGSYGCTPACDFDPAMISILDRGFFLACAHVRGGGEFGTPWWNSGKKLNKKNAVMDYLACAEFLLNQGFTHKGMITAGGTGAGGIVIAAAVNQNPELFKAVVLDDPLTDLIPILLDSAAASAPPYNQAEFGDPYIQDQFNYIKSYSPYDNIKKQDYPAMFILTSSDAEGMYKSGPLKMTAKLRAIKTDDNILLISTGNKVHGKGENDPEGYLELMAEKWAFILGQYGIDE